MLLLVQHIATKFDRKFAVTNSDSDYIAECRVFKILDKPRPTATGLDGLPAWFLRLVAPIFCRPLSHLFNFSLSTSTVSHQGKQAWIRSVPKIFNPAQPIQLSFELGFTSYISRKLVFWRI